MCSEPPQNVKDGWITDEIASCIDLIDPTSESCQTASNRDPGSAWKRDPSPALGQACPGSEQAGTARAAPCLHERRRGGGGGGVRFPPRDRPGWHSGAVFEAPALVAGLVWVQR